MLAVDPVEPIGRVHAVHATHAAYAAQEITALIYNTEYDILTSNNSRISISECSKRVQNKHVFRFKQFWKTQANLIETKNGPGRSAPDQFRPDDGKAARLVISAWQLGFFVEATSLRHALGRYNYYM